MQHCPLLQMTIFCCKDKFVSESRCNLFFILINLFTVLSDSYQVHIWQNAVENPILCVNVALLLCPSFFDLHSLLSWPQALSEWQYFLMIYLTLLLELFGSVYPVRFFLTSLSQFMFFHLWPVSLFKSFNSWITSSITWSLTVAFTKGSVCCYVGEVLSIDGFGVITAKAFINLSSEA